MWTFIDCIEWGGGELYILRYGTGGGFMRTKIMGVGHFLFKTISIPRILFHIGGNFNCIQYCNFGRDVGGALDRKGELW